MIPGVVNHVGQAVADASRTLASTAVSPFQALLADSQPSEEVTLQKTKAASEDPSGFSALYSKFEKLVGDLLGKLPDLPSVRVEVAQGGKLTVAVLDDAAAQNPEIASRIQELETLLNSDHRIVEVADRLQQGKSQQAWRDGLPHQNNTVQFVFTR